MRELNNQPLKPDREEEGRKTKINNEPKRKYKGQGQGLEMFLKSKILLISIRNEVREKLEK